MQAHLRAHPDIQYVWYDYACIPQKLEGIGRTAAEETEFDLMLSAVADLYLTAKVIAHSPRHHVPHALLDDVTMEGWCSMQTATRTGVRPALEGEGRHTVCCIHNADDNDKRALLTMSTKTADEITNFLGSPDVAVTNQKDKETMLPIVGKTDEHVREMMSGMHRQV